MASKDAVGGEDLLDVTGPQGMVMNQQGENVKIGLTEFLEEDRVVEKMTTDNSELSAQLRRIGKFTDEQDIKSFLTRPVTVRTGTLGAGTLRGAAIQTIYPFHQLATLNPYKSKLEGFLGLRATAHIRIEVDTTSKQACYLMLAFAPLGQLPGMNFSFKTRDLRAYSQLPNIQFNTARTTVATLTIPYVHSDMFFNMTDRSGEVGVVRLVSMSPFYTGTGSTSAGYKIKIFFTDVELMAPTDWQPQIGDNPEEAEAKAMGQKPMSGGLAVASTAMGIFAKIPLLSSIATPASWALSGASQLARAFGYSKPTNQTGLVRYSQNNWSYMTNFDGNDTSVKLGMSTSTSTSIQSGTFGSDKDELSFSYLHSIPTYGGFFFWTDETLSGDTIWEEALSSQTFCEAGPSISTIGEVFYCTPMGYFQEFYQFWRGSIVITIKIVKTPDHRGKLRFSYSPGSVSAITQPEYLVHEILDIAAGDEWSFVVPYASQSVWKQNPNFNPSPNADEALGNVKLEVYNRLAAPSTVSNTVEVMLFINGGPDFEYAVPRVRALNPQYDGIDTALTPQIGDPDAPVKAFYQPLGATEAITGPNLAATHMGSGEKVTSAMQLLKKFHKMTFVQNVSSPTANPFGTSTPGTGIGMNPFRVISIPPTLQKSAYMQDDPYNVIAACYALSKGSMRLKFAPYLRVASKVKLRTIGGTFSPFEFVNASTTVDGSAKGPISDYSPTTEAFFPGVTVFPEVEVPGYQLNITRVNSARARDTVAQQWGKYDALSTVFITRADNVAVDQPMSDIYRGVGEDFQMGMFCGVPPLVRRLYDP